MGIQIEQATDADIEEIAVILGEVEQYYGGDNVPGIPGEIRDALFGPVPAAVALVAREDSAVVGFASYSFLWPAAGSTSSLYLKELYVREQGRGAGVGRALMDALAAIARQRGCSRMEWTGDRDNPAALGFYEHLGVDPHDGKVFYRLLL